MKLYDEEFYAVNHSETYLFLFPILMPQINIKSAFTSINWDFNSISYSRAICARWKNLPQYKNVTRKYFFFFTFFKRIYLKCETIYDFFFHSNTQVYVYWSLRLRPYCSKNYCQQSTFHWLWHKNRKSFDLVYFTW